MVQRIGIVDSDTPTSTPAGDKPLASRCLRPRYIPLSPPLWIPAFAGMTKRGAGVYPGSESGTCFRSDDRAGRRGDEVTGVDRPPVAHLLISRRYEFEAAESALPGSANNFQHRDSGGVGTAYDLAAARSAMTGHLTSD